MPDIPCPPKVAGVVALVQVAEAPKRALRVNQTVPSPSPSHRVLESICAILAVPAPLFPLKSFITVKLPPWSGLKYSLPSEPAAEAFFLLLGSTPSGPATFFKPPQDGRPVAPHQLSPASADLP